MIISLHTQSPQPRIPLLSPSRMPSFQDPEIQRISNSYLGSSVSNAENHDVERPSKRARLAIVSGDQTMDGVRSNIVSRIYSLLGIQNNTALAGLGQHAVWVTAIPFSIHRC